MGIFDKFKTGFQKSASALKSGLKEIIIKKEIDDKTLDEIEDFLIQSDVGVAASEEIKNIIAAALKVSDAQKITLFPLDFKILPIFPIVVVFPTPLTPDIRIAFKSVLFKKKFSFSKGDIKFNI
jgi:hypothetical protein